MLAAAARVAQLDHRAQLVAIAAVLFLDRRLIELQCTSQHIRLEQTRAAQALAGNVDDEGEVVVLGDCRPRKALRADWRDHQHQQDERDQHERSDPPEAYESV